MGGESLILYAEGLKELLTLWNAFENKVLFMESGIFFTISQDLISHVFLGPTFTPSDGCLNKGLQNRARVFE